MKRYIKASKSTEIDLKQLTLDLERAVESFADKIDLDKSYTRIDIDEQDEYIDIEIGMEADFDELYELCTILDKIIIAYDSDAYFENKEPGIIGAIIWKTYTTIHLTVGDSLDYSGEFSVEEPEKWLADIIEKNTDIYYTVCAIIEKLVGQGIDFSSETSEDISDEFFAFTTPENFWDESYDRSTFWFDSLALNISDIGFDGTKFNPIHIVYDCDYADRF